MTRSLHVVSTDLRRGAETFGTQLVVALRGLGQRADVVALEARGGSLDIEVLDGRRFSLNGLKALREAARDVDVVVAHGSSALPAAAFALTTLRTPLVYRNIGDPGHWHAGAMRRLRVITYMQRVDHIVALTGAFSDLLVSRRPRRPVSTIPNAVPRDRVVPTSAAGRAAGRAALDVDSGPVVVFVGSLTGEKRPSLVVEAMAHLPEATLVLAGDGPLRAGLEGRAAQVAPSRVRFLGSVTDVGDVLGVADVLVLTSTTEGMPAVLIEAGLAAIPVVAPAIGGVAEVVQHGVTGLVLHQLDPIHLADAVRTTVGRRDDMGAAARVHVLANFELQPIARQWATLLEALGMSGRRS